MKEIIRIRGCFGLELLSPQGESLRKWYIPNGVTTVGINDFLDIYFRNGSPSATWHMGLIDNSGFTALASGDTMASHSGWTENQDYDEATRPAWSPGAASGGVVENSSAVDFTMNSVVTIKGLFIVDENTKGGTSGILWSTGLLPVPQEVQSGSVLRGYYSLEAQAG